MQKIELRLIESSDRLGFGFALIMRKIENNKSKSFVAKPFVLEYTEIPEGGAIEPTFFLDDLNLNSKQFLRSVAEELAKIGIYSNEKEKAQSLYNEKDMRINDKNEHLNDLRNIINKLFNTKEKHYEKNCSK